MAYFVPYIDSTGIHMPTYEDRLADLVTAYQSIFGIDSELSPAVPDYQMLSIFAKALDDTAGLVVQDFNSRNPMFATGAALDLMLPQYGITRASGESDADLRNRIKNSLAGRSNSSYDALLAAVKSARAVKDARVYINETDTTDANGIPAHTIAVITKSGYTSAVAQAIWDNKAPGIGTYGTLTGTATDASGGTHSVKFSRYSNFMIQIFPFITVLSGGSQAAITAAIKPAIFNFVDALGIGEGINIPQLYGVAYAADPAIANTFVITDIQVAVPGGGSVQRGYVPIAWNQKVTVDEEQGIDIRYS